MVADNLEIILAELLVSLKNGVQISVRGVRLWCIERQMFQLKFVVKSSKL